MKPNKYTIMFIPDNESGSRSIHLSKFFIKLIVLLFGLMIISIFVFSYVYIPKINSYNDIKYRHDILVEERMKVLELTRDLERLKQMDEMVRYSLGEKLDINERTITTSICPSSTPILKPNMAGNNLPSIKPIDDKLPANPNP